MISIVITVPDEVDATADKLLGHCITLAIAGKDATVQVYGMTGIVSGTGGDRPSRFAPDWPTDVVLDVTPSSIPPLTVFARRRREGE